MHDAHKAIDFHTLLKPEIELLCKMANDAHLNDVIEAIQISANGFLISERLKSIFEKHRLEGCAYYPTKVSAGKAIASYYYFHSINDLTQKVDFKKSAFDVIDLVKKTKLLENKVFADLEEFDDFYMDILGEPFDVVPLKITFPDAENSELFHLNFTENRFYLSDSLGKELLASEITGLTLRKL
ncbi:MAG: hypothetical protein AAGD28_20865 [Bacteroidota bacterium]